MTLVFAFYHLARNPLFLSTLQEELDTLDPNPEMQHLQELPYLNGVINETMRLHPAVPTGGLRQTPPEGAVIAGRFVPGDTVICAPRYSLSRLETCFEQPHDFIPERWSTRPDLIKDKAPFAPFALGKPSLSSPPSLTLVLKRPILIPYTRIRESPSINDVVGRYYCIGKNLAYMEMRSVLALLARRYDIIFPEGETGADVERDMVDQFTAAPGALRVVLTLRRKG
ncbi:MAG: hypothetical protein Q9183_004505 [Haloplaca sp. 2 TL-2023]